MDSQLFETSFCWTMTFEDPLGRCAIVPDPGGFAISGINSAAFPTEYATIAAASPSSRAPMVKAFYETHFWNRWLESLNDVELAKRVFDAGVNMGAGTAVKILQTATGLQVDGCWRPKTLTSANSGIIVPAFINARVAHYEDILAKNPADEKYREVWMARARK